MIVKESIEEIKMQTRSKEHYTKVNPLVGLPAKTIRLYCALEVFRAKSNSIDRPEWFRTPNRDEVLEQVGFSKTDIDSGISELIAANLLLIQNKNNDQWYCLK